MVSLWPLTDHPVTAHGELRTDVSFLIVNYWIVKCLIEINERRHPSAACLADNPPNFATLFFYQLIGFCHPFFVADRPLR